MVVKTGLYKMMRIKKSGGSEMFWWNDLWTSAKMNLENWWFNPASICHWIEDNVTHRNGCLRWITERWIQGIVTLLCRVVRARAPPRPQVIRTNRAILPQSCGRSAASKKTWIMSTIALQKSTTFYEWVLSCFLSAEPCIISARGARTSDRPAKGHDFLTFCTAVLGFWIYTWAVFFWGWHK